MEPEAETFLVQLMRPEYCTIEVEAKSETEAAKIALQLAMETELLAEWETSSMVTVSEVQKAQK